MINRSYAVIPVTEKKGHFEKGIWVDEPVPAKSDESPIDIRLQAATRGVFSALDELAKATHDLVTTEEGKKHIEKTVNETTAEIQKSFDGLVSQVKEHAKAQKDKALELKKAAEAKAKQ
jgi:hypothetical protein